MLNPSDFFRAERTGSWLMPDVTCYAPHCDTVPEQWITCWSRALMAKNIFKFIKIIF